MEGAAICPHWVDIHSGHGFAFTACNASASTTIHRFTVRLMDLHAIPQNISLIKGLILQQKKWNNRLCPWNSSTCVKWRKGTEKKDFYKIIIKFKTELFKCCCFYLSVLVPKWDILKEKRKVALVSLNRQKPQPRIQHPLPAEFLQHYFPVGWCQGKKTSF